MLNGIAKSLDDNKTVGRKAKIVGSGAGIAGGLAAVISIPLTGGLSAFVIATGIALGIGGAVKGFHADRKMDKTEQTLLEEAKAVLEHDEQVAKHLEHALERVKTDVDKLVRKGFRIGIGTGMATCGVVRVSAKLGPRIISRFPRAASVLGNTVRLGRIAKGAGAALAVVFIPFDIWEIVDNANGLKSGCEVAASVRKVVQDLEVDLADKESMLQSASDNIMPSDSVS